MEEVHDKCIQLTTLGPKLHDCYVLLALCIPNEGDYNTGTTLRYVLNSKVSLALADCSYGHSGDNVQVHFGRSSVVQNNPLTPVITVQTAARWFCYCGPSSYLLRSLLLVQLYLERSTTLYQARVTAPYLDCGHCADCVLGCSFPLAAFV